MDANDWCFIYSLWCTSHEHLVLSHPKNILTPNTKYDIRWYIVQPISKHIPTPSLVSLSYLSIIVIGWVFFFTWITPDGWALLLFYLIIYSCPELCFGMHVLHCLVSTNQYLEQTDRKFNLFNKTISIYWKIWWSEKEQWTQKIKILNWGTREHRDSFHRNKRTGTHWEGLNIFSYAKILCAQTMAIICIWFWYDKNPFSLHVISSYKTV